MKTQLTNIQFWTKDISKQENAANSLIDELTHGHNGIYQGIITGEFTHINVI